MLANADSTVKTGVLNCLRVTVQDCLLKRLLVRALAVVNTKDVQQLHVLLRENVKKFDSQIEDVIESFGVPKAVLEMIPAAND